MTTPQNDNEITNLLIVTAAIPEIREDLKEVMRALKGSNGRLGLVARQSQLEQQVANQRNELADFKRVYEADREKTNQLINERFDTLAEKIDCMKDGRALEESELRKMRKSQEFTLKRDWRAFVYGVLAGSIMMIIERIVGLFN